MTGKEHTQVTDADAAHRDINELITGPGYAAAARYRGPDGTERTKIARSGPGLPHPEWQLHSFFERTGTPGTSVVELYTELEACAVPGGNCAALISRVWPNVKVSHTAEYGGDADSRRRGMDELVRHVQEIDQREGRAPRPAPHRLPLPEPGSVRPLPQPHDSDLRAALIDVLGSASVLRFPPVSGEAAGHAAKGQEFLSTAGLPASYPPYFAAESDPAKQLLELSIYAEAAGLRIERHIAEGHRQRGYYRIGTDFGREICVEKQSGQVWAVELASGWASFVNSDVPAFIRCITLLGKQWPLRRGMDPREAAVHTAQFQKELAERDAASLGGPNHWWAVVVEQMWDGLL
jgi:hypothetical protein